VAVRLELVINGKRMTLENVQTIADLLHARGLNPQLVAVEHNGEIVPRDQFDQRLLRDGDQLEIVHFVGGGSPAHGTCS
jgi:thiamine biosynthesis protein ThiS